MEKKIKWGRIAALGIVGTCMLAMLAAPSALAQNANGLAQNANAPGQAVNKRLLRGEGRNQMKPPLDLEDVTVTVQYLDNGIKETFVTQEQSVMAQMKNVVTRLNKAEENKDDTVKIDVVAEATDTGMVITTTSSDAEIAARIMAHAQIRELERKLREAGVDIKESITRTVTETDNGVVITLSSTNADVARLLQLREKYPMEGPGPGPLNKMQPGNRPLLPLGQLKKGLRGKMNQGNPDTAVPQDVTE